MDLLPLSSSTHVDTSLLKLSPPVHQKVARRRENETAQRVCKKHKPLSIDTRMGRVAKHKGVDSTNRPKIFLGHLDGERVGDGLGEIPTTPLSSGHSKSFWTPSTSCDLHVIVPPIGDDYSVWTPPRLQAAMRIKPCVTQDATAHLAMLVLGANTTESTIGTYEVGPGEDGVANTLWAAAYGAFYCCSCRKPLEAKPSQHGDLYREVVFFVPNCGHALRACDDCVADVKCFMCDEGKQLSSGWSQSGCLTPTFSGVSTDPPVHGDCVVAPCATCRTAFRAR